LATGGGGTQRLRNDCPGGAPRRRSRAAQARRRDNKGEGGRGSPPGHVPSHAQPARGKKKSANRLSSQCPLTRRGEMILIKGLCGGWKPASRPASQNRPGFTRFPRCQTGKTCKTRPVFDPPGFRPAGPPTGSWQRAAGERNDCATIALAARRAAALAPHRPAVETIRAKGGGARHPGTCPGFN